MIIRFDHQKRYSAEDVAKVFGSYVGRLVRVEHNNRDLKVSYSGILTQKEGELIVDNSCKENLTVRIVEGKLHDKRLESTIVTVGSKLSRTRGFLAA